MGFLDKLFSACSTPDTIGGINLLVGTLRGRKTISFTPPPGTNANDVMKALKAQGESGSSMLIDGEHYITVRDVAKARKIIDSV